MMAESLVPDAAAQGRILARQAVSALDVNALNFLPKQRGMLRVFDGGGKELLREPLPEGTPVNK